MRVTYAFSDQEPVPHNGWYLIYETGDGEEYIEMSDEDIMKVQKGATEALADIKGRPKEVFDPFEAVRTSHIRMEDLDKDIGSITKRLNDLESNMRKRMIALEEKMYNLERRKSLQVLDNMFRAIHDDDEEDEG